MENWNYGLQRTDAAAGICLLARSNDRLENSGLFGPFLHPRSSLMACSFVPLANVPLCACMGLLSGRHIV